MSGTANPMLRHALHAEPPPPIQARFFYTSPIPIDDPLSPVPPTYSGTTSAKQPPKPFSDFDNRALEREWQTLRKATAKYREQQAEKAATRSRTRAGSSGSRDARSASSSKPATPRVRPTKPTASSLSQVDGPSIDEDADVDSKPAIVIDNVDGPHSASEVSDLPTTTGTPFIRAPSRRKLDTLKDERLTRPRFQARDTYLWDDNSHLVDHSPPPSKHDQLDVPTCKVPVGISRLHQVGMPKLEMTPIYWKPVHDTAPVVRSTWFYQDTMLPVESHVANMLEAGYVDLRVWTDTWKDELNSAIDVGAVGEEKIVHKLWPDKIPSSAQESRPSSSVGFASRDNLLRTATSNLTDANYSPEQARDKAVEAACDMINAAVGPDGPDNEASGTLGFGRQGAIRNFASYGVIYANAREARLLKPNLLPSHYYGRRPLANYIRKGHKIGIPVVRGFDQAAWDRLHPSTTTPKTAKAERGVATSDSGVAPSERRKSDAGLARAERPQVTDLILVIHGIGQKLSRRMESFHFTHAMNAFRREVNVEVGTKEVNSNFRQDMGSIMVLPVNWRESLSFEEGGYRDGPDKDLDGEFTLQDITPDTLPSVRNIVSDVMLDIPYYMSHHQSKMIAAVVAEANQVYQLWCQNNPGFNQHGRVHLIGHSLGSVMAIDILSRQPTTIPHHLADPVSVDLEAEKPDHFLFNTSNLFLAGSPAGFFLLLRKAQLKPRIDQPSASAEADPISNTSLVCGERGEYGCIPVDNVYNILNGYDPVSYRMNATVDSVYAESLKKSFIPSSAPGWFGSRSGSTSWFAGSGSNTAAQKKQPVLPRLPSNVELETHNFTREEVAEKRMYLLNDNGQIDFFLRYGGGPLEIQYITMLSAHSSYWLLRDFTRMIVLEVGRKPGREGALSGMRAIKKKGVPVAAAATS